MSSMTPLSHVSSRYTPTNWMIIGSLSSSYRGGLRTSYQPHSDERSNGFRLTQAVKLQEVLQAILAFAEACKPNTIEKVLGKSDVEVAVDFLSGKLRR